MPTAIEVARDLFDSLVQLPERLAVSSGQVTVSCRGVCITRDKAVKASQEAIDAGNTVLLPIKIAIRRRGKEGIETRGISAVLRYHTIGRNDIAQAFRHLSALFDDHALREEASGRLVIVDHADIAHHLGPEARVDEVENGMFDSADVLVDGKPMRNRLQVERSYVVARIAIAVEVPGRVNKSVHGIAFAPGGFAALRAVDVHELVYCF